MKDNPPAASLDDRSLAEYVAFACHLGEIAGGAILPHFRAPLDVENKGAPGSFYDPVTIADRAAESAIRTEIARVYPGHGVHGEEQGLVRGSDDFIWVIDPIDGTRGFIVGHVQWGVLIALNDGIRPIVGVMHQPYIGETFAGSRLGAEFRRGNERRPLRTRHCKRIEDAAVCATDPGMFREGDERAAFRAVASRARLARYGGDCYSYCMLAAGMVDLVIECGNYAYDLQALIPIIEAAGGVITNWSGEPVYDGGQSVAAGDPALHEVALQLLAQGAR